MNPRHLALAAAFGVVLTTSACIVVIDDTGMSAHAAWNHDWRSTDGPTLRGSGVAASEAREVADFRAVEVRGSTDVHVRVGAEKSVVVHADDNLLERVVTRVEDGLLIVEMERGSYRFRCEHVVEIGAPALDRLAVCGSGDAQVEGLDQAAFSVSVAGSGNVVAAGRVDALSASIAGSGDLELFGLKARSAKVSIAGSGDVEIDTSDDLSVDISGSGDVRYRGSPQVRRSIAGSGSVERD